jgi:hypothetical protein
MPLHLDTNILQSYHFRAIFCNDVKGKSMLALPRDLSISYKAAFVLAHKLREAMAEELKGRTPGGEGKVAEVDGGYFGGYVKPVNRRFSLVANLRIIQFILFNFLRYTPWNRREMNCATIFLTAFKNLVAMN